MRYDQGSGRVAVSSGFAEVTAERVTILVRRAVCSDLKASGNALGFHCRRLA